MIKQSGDFHIVLPFPPSVNTYWRTTTVKVGRKMVQRTLLSAKGRKYKAAVKQQMYTATRPRQPYDGRLIAVIELAAPDNRRRDIDNHVKPILDVMTENGIWIDDEQVDELHVKRLPVERPGFARLSIMPAEASILGFMVASNGEWLSHYDRELIKDVCL